VVFQVCAKNSNFEFFGFGCANKSIKAKKTADVFLSFRRFLVQFLCFISMFSPAVFSPYRWRYFVRVFYKQAKVQIFKSKKML